MSNISKKRKTRAEHDAQIEKMHRHIGEICDRECREQNHEWIKRLSKERAAACEKEKRESENAENR